jgi:hypothetical protein
MWQRIRKPLATILAVQVLAWAVGQVVARVLAIGDEHSDEFRIATLSSGREFHGTADRFRSGSALALMGGLKLDLRDVTLDPEGAVLELNATMGGIEVRVPEDWAVDVDERSIAGGFEANVTAPEDLPDDAPVLHVRARNLMGGTLVTTEP